MKSLAFICSFLFSMASFADCQDLNGRYELNYMKDHCTTKKLDPDSFPGETFPLTIFFPKAISYDILHEDGKVIPDPYKNASIEQMLNYGETIYLENNRGIEISVNKNCNTLSFTYTNQRAVMTDPSVEYYKGRMTFAGKFSADKFKVKSSKSDYGSHTGSFSVEGEDLRMVITRTNIKGKQVVDCLFPKK